MSSVPKIFSFATEGPYEAYLKRLAKSCVEHGYYQIDMRVVPPFASWHEAAMHKPMALWHEVWSTKAHGLLYLDADAEIVRSFELPCFPSKVKDAHPVAMPRDPVTGHPMTNVIWVSDAWAALPMIIEWATWAGKQVATKHLRGDQDYFSFLPDPWSNIAELPPEYSWIPDISPRTFGDREPYIIQHQASRQHKGGR